ncbi:MAG TPA: hypothetical protein DCO72_10075 [Ruminococcus sp.]|nr:hypothetical protein [Ruminococcus sp.]
MIYGNDAVLQLIQKMAEREHLPHACLIYGEKGTGRKTIADYLAMTALCTGEHAPCGNCPSCRKMRKGIHPDYIHVEHSGKKNGFSVETVRNVCRDAVIAPNDGSRKIYLFADCDNIDSRSQNTLLKLTEEPPEHVLLMFTAVQKNVFLDTMLSRMMLFAVRPCTAEECFQALTQEHECPPAEAERAVQTCGGNIGKCLDWLENEEMQELTRQTAMLTDAVSARRHYEVLRILAQFEKDRQKTAVLLEYFDIQLRDAIIMKYGQCDRMGCDKTSAERLSAVLTLSSFQRMHEAVRTAYNALQANVSVKLVLASLGGSLLS